MMPTLARVSFCLLSPPCSTGFQACFVFVFSDIQARQHKLDSLCYDASTSFLRVSISINPRFFSTVASFFPNMLSASSR